ncbi:MAG TPA: MFS transporter [Rhizomicrobium sp.]|jgi:MFS family permease
MQDRGTGAENKVRESTPPSARQIAAVATGNALEFYDFTIYAYFARQIGETFFPSHSPFVSLMGSLAAFGIGFVGRPIGAVLIGAYGDRAGRKPAMLLSFALMGAAILLLAFTPSFAAIGVTAPAIVVIARLLQGIAVGGDVGPTTAFLLESAPAERRGFYTSLQYSTQGVSTLLGGLIGFALSSVLGAHDLVLYGWRIAFLAGALILPIGFVIRRSLPETLHQDAPAPEDVQAAQPWRAMVLGFLMLGGATIGFYVLAYLTTYASTVLHMKTNVSFGATIAFGVANIISGTLSGILSDRIGRWPVMVFPRVLLILAIYPGFALIVHNRDAVTLLGVAFGLGFLNQMSVAGFVALSESLPKSMRSVLLATVYALAITLFGGTTQLGVTWLLHLTGNAMAPAWYYLVGAVANLIAVILMRETAPVVLRRRAMEQAGARRLIF